MSAHLNVLHLRNTITDGGAERVLLNWCKFIDRDRIRFRLACFANPGGVEDCLLRPAAELDIPTSRIPWGRSKSVIRALNAVVGILRTQKIAILHSHDAKSDVIAWLAHRRTGVPVVGAAYAWFGGKSVARNRIYEWLDARLLASFHSVIAISDSLRQESIARGLDAARVTVVRTGIDYEGLQSSTARGEVRARLGLAENDIAVLNLARLYPEKGQEVLLAALARVAAAEPAAKLVIIGEGPLRAELESLAGSLGVANRVQFMEFPERLADWLPAFDMQVHSSHYEGIPIAILQGMAVGLPVVSTNVGGISEIIKPGETGLLVPDADPDALAAGVMRLIRDRHAASQMAHQARAYVRANYSMPAAVNLLAKVYERVAGEQLMAGAA